jgi:hypothetical protein
LFADAMERYKECLAIIPRLRVRGNGEAVEQAMERLRDEGTNKPRRQRQLVAIRYYLQDMLNGCQRAWNSEVCRGVTNYKTLLDTVEYFRKEKDPVCLVTFNYDTMIEDALPSDVKQIQDIKDYILGSSVSYSLIKLHGSVDWGREIGEILDKNIPIPQQVIKRYPHLDVTDTYRRVQGQSPVTSFKDTRLFPAIAIPVQSKLTYECPKQHVDTLHSLIPQVTKILIVGWRGTEKPFLKNLRTGLPNSMRVMIVCGYKRWGEETLKNLDLAESIRVADYGFSELVTTKRLELDGFLTS